MEKICSIAKKHKIGANHKKKTSRKSIKWIFCLIQWNGWKICFNVTEFFFSIPAASSRRMEILLASSYGASQKSRTKWQEETSSRIGSEYISVGRGWILISFSLFFCYFIQYLWLFAECETGKSSFIYAVRRRRQQNCYLSIFLGYFLDITLILFVLRCQTNLWFMIGDDLFFGKAEVVCWIWDIWRKILALSVIFTEIFCVNRGTVSFWVLGISSFLSWLNIWWNFSRN